MLWMNIMLEVRKGILGLQFYNAETSKWGQAHAQGAFVCAQYLYQNQKSNFLRFEINEAE